MKQGMSIRKTLLMLTLNYILIFVWMFWARLEVVSALIIFPVTMVVAFFDTILAEGRKSALLWCGNLLISTIVGIILQNYLYARYTRDTETAMLRAVVEITVAIFLISITAAISGGEAAKLRKSRKKKMNTVPVRSTGFLFSKDAKAEYEDDDDEDEYLEEFEKRRTMSLRSQVSSGDEPDDEDEDIDEREKPVFRVIKK